MSDSIYQTYRVIDRRKEGSVGGTLILDGAIEAEPGQFLMVWLPGIEERPIAVMDDDPLSLTVREIGPFTRALAACLPGDRVWVRGPYGRGFSVQHGRHLLVGGGSGIASLTLLAKRLMEAGAEVQVALGARTREELMLAWRFEQLECPLLLATDDGSAGVKGTVVDAIGAVLETHWPTAVHACGPEPMLAAVVRLAQTHDIPAFLSLERAMKCGIGVCGNCHCGDRLVCSDGPVFQANEISELLVPLG